MIIAIYMLSIFIQNSILSKMEKIQFPWLAFSGKIRSGNILLQDATGITDSMLLLFGGKIYLSEKVTPLMLLLILFLYNDDPCN